jgi:hypothetical protein
MEVGRNTSLYMGWRSISFVYPFCGEKLHISSILATCPYGELIKDAWCLAHSHNMVFLMKGFIIHRPKNWRHAKNICHRENDCKHSKGNHQASLFSSSPEGEAWMRA